MEKTKERNILMDNLKGFLMICVVLGHFCEQYNLSHPNLDYAIFFIYLFHMPCFIYISGYFSKNYSFKKNFKLIYQYVVFGLIYVLIVNRFPDVHLKFEISTALWSLWYLLSLFYWRTITHFIKTQKVALVIIISFICAIFVGCFKDIGNYFSIARTIGFFPFFLLGYYSNKDTLQKIRKISKIIIIPLILVILLCTYIIVYTNWIPLMFQWSSKSFNDLEISNIDGVLYKIIILILETLCCVILINITPNKKTIFSYLGENTITIYGFHAAIVYSTTYFIKDVPYKGAIYLLVLSLTFATAFLLSSKPIRKFYALLMKPYKKISEDGDAK